MDTVDNYIGRQKKWKTETELLRAICLECGLVEDFKWMHPCYTYTGSNVVLIHGFKEYCALLFPKGVLLKDTDNLLIQQTPNVQTARQLRFTDEKDIRDKQSIIKAYIFEAVEVEKAGLEPTLKETSEFAMPEEFKQALEGNVKLKSAFNNLTPGRQRGYLLYFAQAKQSKTRMARIAKFSPHIMKGKGLND